MSSDIDTAHGDIYGIGQWGSGLVTILENGHIGLCHPFDPDSTPTDLRHIVEICNSGALPRLYCCG